MAEIWARLVSLTDCQFSIDQLLNPLIPASQLGHLPRLAARFLGHRTENPKPVGTLVTAFWSLVGVFCGVGIVELASAHVWTFRAPDDYVSNNSDNNNSKNTMPVMIASFGASAVLEFCAIEAPLAQPRNAVFGQLLSSVVGVSIARLFRRLPSLASRWLGGAAACALATVGMVLTDTVHPPAGATAMIAVADERVAALGWRLVPSVLLGSVLMQCAALLLNNVQRRFPVYWWTSGEVGKFWRERRQQQKQQQLEGIRHKDSTADMEVVQSEFSGSLSIVVLSGRVIVPESIYLGAQEKMLLESLSHRL